MSPRERLHLLVDELGDEQAERALRMLEALAEQESARSLPAFVGMGHSGQGDIARRAKEILREELGRAGQPPL